MATAGYSRPPLAQEPGIVTGSNIQKALDILSKANKIEFYGQGTSGIVAAGAQLTWPRC
jgi:DNA-binding MurR/RpiR family transcriptional regulator